MIKKTMMVALAFVGLVVGAGFASGQELLQYFVSHGIQGIWGAIIAAVAMSLAGLAILQLGSYFRAKEHSIVYEHVASPVFSRALDLFTSFTLFCIGFVMIAGAGSNLNQQFGLPVWVGSVLMIALVFLASMLDVEKVTRVIGFITPFIILFVIGACVYAYVTAGASLDANAATAATLTPSVGHWLVSALNYVGIALALAVSMAIVMGGNEFNPRAAGIGGFAGGAVFGILLVMSTVALLMSIDVVKDVPMPMLELVDSIHPALGVVMSVVIYAMIFNTAIGVYYALGKRISSTKPKIFLPTMGILLVAGFALSFVGFESLIAILYPIMGYVGIVLIGTLVIAWLRNWSKIRREGQRRHRIRTLTRKRWERGVHLTRKERRELRLKLRASNLDDKELSREMSREVVAEIHEDDDAEVERAWKEVSRKWAHEQAIEAALGSEPTTVVMATNNAHKASEVATALGFPGMRFKTLRELGFESHPEENGDSFLENARIKARAARELSGGMAALADDSGLEVDALNGAPGIHSARYASEDGSDAPDAANNAKLLRALEGVPDDKRTARFVSELVFIDEDGTEIVAHGTIEGRIGHAPRGAEGFGYDPLFFPDALNHERSLAEVTQKEKNAISHRGNALRMLHAKLRARHEQGQAHNTAAAANSKTDATASPERNADTCS